MSKTIAIVNQKGGVGKTTTTATLGVALAEKNKKVLLIDADAQASLTVAFGFNPNETRPNLSQIIADVINCEEGKKYEPQHSEEGIDLIPSDLSLAYIEQQVNTAIAAENIFKEYIDTVKSEYDYILIDCSPSLGIYTKNALTASDSVIIPVTPDYLATSGLTQLLGTIKAIKRRLNPDLEIEGVLLTQVKENTRVHRQTIAELYESFEQYENGTIKIFNSKIPYCIKATETTGYGKTMNAFDSKGKATVAYKNLTEEVEPNGKTNEIGLE